MWDWLSSVRSNGGPVGVQVARLEPGGRAEEAGVPVGALVVQLNGQDVTHYTVPELNSLLASLKVNQTGVFATLHVRIVDPASQTTSGTEDTYVSAAQQLKPNKTISPAMLEKVDAAGWIPAIDAAGRSVGRKESDCVSRKTLTSCWTVHSFDIPLRFCCCTLPFCCKLADHVL